jgi:hypothetical protein
MVDFGGAKHRAIEELAKVVTVYAMSDAEREAAGFKKYSSSWSISTEVFTYDGTVKPITLFIILPDDFPLVLPRIYISKKDREWIGYIPHVNVPGFICLYDEESIIIDFDHPDEIIKACLKKALHIIEQGLKGENKNDFADEFLSYWTEKYEEKDEIFPGLMMLEQLPEKTPCQLNFFTVKDTYASYQTILFDEGKHSKRFREYLKEKGYSVVEREGLYIGSITGLIPPFNYTNSNTLQIVKDYFPHALKQFERYINRIAGYRLIVFSIVSGVNHLFFGWYIPQLSIARNGFRKGILTPFSVFNSFQRNDKVIRLQFDTYTKERLDKRTDGITSARQYAITVAGLGSIGSNLLPYLTPLGIDSLHLVDPEILTLANINRHLLGPDDIGESKVKGVRNYLLKSNPLTEIVAHQASIVHFIRNKSEILNQSNYLFIVVGKNTVENYVLQALHESQVTVPTFFIWIEPYLIGGHCLYIQPGHSLQYNDLYEDHLFKYNTVDASEYKNSDKQILLREAGCQGSYLPYGQKGITLFLASIVPYLYQLIDNKDNRNLAITWRGKSPDNISLKLSHYGNQLEEGKFQLNEL